MADLRAGLDLFVQKEWYRHSALLPACKDESLETRVAKIHSFCMRSVFSLSFMDALMVQTIALFFSGSYFYFIFFTYKSEM